MQEKVIDLDANATTSLLPEVREAMIEAMDRFWGNASSENVLGKGALSVVEEARSQVAALIGAETQEILFTSGATESINLAIQGTVRLHHGMPNHIITTASEHSAVLKLLDYLYEQENVELTVVPTDRWGRVDPADIKAALKDHTRIVAVIHGNNEIGSLNPVDEISVAIGNHPARLFVDAAQTAGFCLLSVKETKPDLSSISAHKMYGPKGVGCLYLRKGNALKPLLVGGGQERGYRPGTYNVPAIVGFGVACQIALARKEERYKRTLLLRERFLGAIQKGVPDIRLNGHPQDRLPNNLNLTIPYVDARQLIARLPNLAFSRGSACTSASGEPNHVLQALGFSKEETLWTIRLGFGCILTTSDIDEAAHQMITTITALRGD